MAKPKGKATTETARPLLDLSTVEQVEFIKVDGTRYEFINLDAQPLRARQKVSDQLTAVLQLVLAAADKELSRNKERQLTAGVKALIPMILPTLPPAVLGKLNETHRQEIVMAFFVVRSERLGGSTVLPRMAAMTDRLAKRSTGATSSQGSNGSTAAPSRTGGRKSRSRSSGRSRP